VCLATPAKVLEVRGEEAVVDFGGLKKNVNIQLVEVKPNEWVLVHAGFAIQKISEERALETLAIYEEMAKLQKEMKKRKTSD